MTRDFLKYILSTLFIFLFRFIKSLMPFLIASITSLYIALSSYIGGIIIGCLWGLLLASEYKVIWFIPFLVIHLVRSIPVLIYILFFYYGLPQFGIQWGPIKACVVAFLVRSSADIAHIIYRGIVTISKDQHEGAHALGFSLIQTKLYIILPQALLTMATELTNYCIRLIQLSSITAFIGVHEITTTATTMYCVSYNAVKPLFLAAITYILVTLLVTFLLTRLQAYCYVPRQPFI